MTLKWWSTHYERLQELQGQEVRRLRLLAWRNPEQLLLAVRKNDDESSLVVFHEIEVKAYSANLAKQGNYEKTKTILELYTLNWNSKLDFRSEFYHCMIEIFGMKREWWIRSSSRTRGKFCWLRHVCRWWSCTMPQRSEKDIRPFLTCDKSIVRGTKMNENDVNAGIYINLLSACIEGCRVARNCRWIATWSQLVGIQWVSDMRSEGLKEPSFGSICICWQRWQAMIHCGIIRMSLNNIEVHLAAHEVHSNERKETSGLWLESQP